ncbi:hypothetical protein BKA70DRAFT_1214923 [Coprinopsis sp. MPI-PUGE-AT-0042]|nr:hypothetical protein BKA70DRAFT_1214923 [Coprinopsis sp. MPI-PUGE-AT-0042]
MPEVSGRVGLKGHRDDAVPELWNIEQFHRIYPQVSQSREQESVAHIASGIERMDAKTPAQSFQKGAQKLKKLAATSRLESSEKERLLSAAERMDKFIPELANTIMEMEAERVGLASDLETVTKEKQRLEKSYRKAHEEAKRYKKCREEKTALQQRIVELEKSYEELQETSHKALERVQGAYSALESQKRALVQEKELLERKLAVAERKAKALAHAKAKMDKKRKRPKEDEGDDSLIVE